MFGKKESIKIGGFIFASKAILTISLLLLSIQNNAKGGLMKKIIFICKGNMHRSPIAKALYNVLKKDDSYAESYGTMVDIEGRTGKKLSSYPGLLNLIDELKQNYGVDISNETCKQVSTEVLKGADKIIVMAEEEFIPGWLREYKYEKWEVPDSDSISPEYAVEDVKNIQSKVERLLLSK